MPAGVGYGLRVLFLGDLDGGFAPWFDDPEERAVAPVLHRTLKEAAARIRKGDVIADVIAAGRETVTGWPSCMYMTKTTRR